MFITRNINMPLTALTDSRIFVEVEQRTMKAIGTAICMLVLLGYYPAMAVSILSEIRK